MPFLITYVPGGSGHVKCKTPEGIDQEAVLVSGRHLLALVEIAISDALRESVKGLAIHLYCSRQQTNTKARIMNPRAEVVGINSLQEK